VIALVNDSSIQDVIKNIVFDFIGAILFGAFAGLLVSWIFTAKKTRRDALEAAHV
jgi:NhaP-type Na+/H+ or K+/H+ antiporter